MHKPILLLAAIAALSTLSGCVSVHERDPDTVQTTSTTRESTVTPVSGTTVERTTVY